MSNYLIEEITSLKNRIEELESFLDSLEIVNEYSSIIREKLLSISSNHIRSEKAAKSLFNRIKKATIEYIFPKVIDRQFYKSRFYKSRFYKRTKNIK